MADINHAYGNILENSNTNIRKISHFFTQRKITESQDILNPTTLKRTKKDIHFTQNYLAIILPKDEHSPRLRIEIFGNYGYCYQGELLSYTNKSPHLLVPLNDDKEMFINIYDYIDDTNNEDNDQEDIDKNINNKQKRIKYISFIHIPKRYQINNDTSKNINESSDLKKLKEKKTQKSLQVSI